MAALGPGGKGLLALLKQVEDRRGQKQDQAPQGDRQADPNQQTDGAWVATADIDLVGGGVVGPVRRGRDRLRAALGWRETPRTNRSAPSIGDDVSGHGHLNFPVATMTNGFAKTKFR